MRQVVFWIFLGASLLWAQKKPVVGKVCEVRFAQEEQRWEDIENLANQLKDSLSSKISEKRGSIYINLKKGTHLKDEDIRKYFQEKNFNPLMVRCMRI